MTQNICQQYPQIVSKLAYHYGWDKPQEQCSWMLQSLMKKGQSEWQAFSYLVENCLKQTNDRELDFQWFTVLKATDQQQRKVA